MPLEPKNVLLLTRVILIKAPSLDFSLEMSAVKQFSRAHNMVAVLLEKLGQKNRIIEDRISRKRILVYIIT